jgi:hypothetical protein
MGSKLHFIRLSLRLIFERMVHFAMFRTLILGILLLSPLLGLTQIELSRSAKISVLTCSEGPELHAAFGHTALHVFDPGNGIDQVYNFGTFDFGAPNFYLNFVKGKLDYFVSVSTYSDFSRYYNYVGRSVIRQELNLNSGQRQAIFEALVHNAKPENRYYRYDFLTENCATKIPEILSIGLGESLNISTHLDAQNLTYRSTIQEHLSRLSWERFGIDLVLGSRVDQPLKGAELAYLPIYLEQLLAESTLSKQPLVISTLLEIPKKYQRVEASFLSSPLFLISLLVLYALFSLWFAKTAKVYALVDSALLLIAGGTGLLLTFLNFFSEHYATAVNFSIFWANPLLIFALITRSKTLYQTVAVLTLLIFPLSLFGVQHFPVELLLCGLLIILLTAKKGAFNRHNSVNPVYHV